MRSRPDFRLWEVRVAFVGPAYETEAGPLGSGECRLTVRAKDATFARRLGVEAAKDALRRLNPGPPQFWSVEAVEPADAEVEPEFEMYEEDALPRTEALRTLLEDLSLDDLRLEIREASLHVVPEAENRFGVAIEYEEMEYRVSTEGWHGHLADAGQAVALFQWLLTPFYRIGKDLQDGELAVGWVERYDGEAWVPYHPVLYRNPSDPTRWTGAWTRVYRQQNARSLGVPFDEIVPCARLDRRGFPKGTVIGRREIPFDRSMAETAGWLDATYSYDPGGESPPGGLE